MDSEMPTTGGAHSVKHLRRVLKKAGLKTTGRKAALTRRLRKAGLKGGQLTEVIKRAADTAKEATSGVIGVGEAALKVPGKAVKAAIGRGRITRRR